MAQSLRLSDRERFLKRIQETVDYCFRLGTSDIIETDVERSINQRLLIHKLINSLQKCLELPKPSRNYRNI